MRYKWRQLFFTDGTSSYSRLITELQLQTAWLAFALILQADNEINHNLYLPYLMPFGSLIPLALMLGSLFAIWMAFTPSAVRGFVGWARRYVSLLKDVLLVCTLIVAVVGTSLLMYSVVKCFLPAQLVDDGTSLDTNAAVLLLHGRNPYTDSSILDVKRRFSIRPIWTTPLRRGQFASRLDYPTVTELQTVFDIDAKTNHANEFESKVSYPAFSFLVLVPFVLLHDYNVLPLSLLSYVLLVIVAWKTSKPEMRRWILLLSVANVPMLVLIISCSLDPFYALLIVLAWLRSNFRWSSALLLGVALATKQPAWFFIPFYGILIWRRYSLQEAVLRLSIAGGIGLAINIPFIIWNPQAWLVGVLAPVADPMFPLGVGFIGLSITHLLPFFPFSVYEIIEGCTMLFALVWYWLICYKQPEAAMLLAVIPLFFSWRSMPSYFSCAAYQIFILIAVKRVSDDPLRFERQLSEKST